MISLEYSAGQKIAQVAVQLSGFYGTYVLEGYDKTTNSWVNLDPTGLTDYNKPRSPSEHTKLFWLDLRSRNVTRLRLSANHRSYYGMPSQVSIPIIRTQYDGPNIYLTPASQHNVVLHWADGGNPQGVIYEIWRETLNSAGQVVADERIGTTTGLTFVTIDQQPGKRYRYRIRAVSEGEISAYTAAVEYFTPPVASVTPGERQLTVSWTPVEGNDKYAIYLEEDGVWRNTGIIGGTNGQAVVTGLSPDKRYRIRLEQHEPKHSGVPWAVLANDSNYTASLWGPPNAPTITNLTPHSVTISWNASNFPDGQIFRLYRNNARIYEGPLTTFTDTEVTPGVEYRYKVTALNAVGAEGAFSPEVSAVTPALAAPTLSLSSAQASNPWNVILTWETNGSPPNTIYEVWRQTLDPSGNVVLDQKIGTTSATSFETMDQTSGKFYRYRVRAVLGTDYLDSNTVTYWTAPVPNVTAMEGALQLDWSPPAPDSAFLIYVNDGSGWSPVQTASGSTATIDSLSPAKHYQVALEPANLPDGGYPWRAVAAERAPLWHAPGTPSFSNVSATSVTISWDPNGIAPGTVYQLFRDGVMIWQGTATSVTDSNLTPNTTYRYKVAALNASGMPGAFTPEADVTTTAKITEPDTPEVNSPIPANGKILIEGATLMDFTVGGTSYDQVPVVPSNIVTLRWDLQSEPEWVRYGTSLASMEQKQKFTPTRTLELTSGSGLKTIYAELSTGELYYQVVLVDREPPSLRISWLGGASVTKPGGQATLEIHAEDDFTPESDLQISVNDGPWQPYRSLYDVHLSGQGIQQIVVRVKDIAGNIATQRISIFVLP